MNKSPRSADKLDTLVKTIRNKVNIQILLILSSKPSYTREIAELLQQDETSVSRRLKSLEKLGIVRSSWKRIGEKNVKIYELNIKEFHIKFDKGALEISLSPGEVYKDKIKLRTPLVPDSPILIGRDTELSIIHDSESPIIHLWGLPGVGKSSLIAWYIKRYRIRDPIYWYTPSPSDTPESLKWKLSILAATNRSVDVRELLSSSVYSLASVFNEAYAIIVFDDFHEMPSEAKRYAIALMEAIEYPARIFVISRFKEKKLPYWKGQILELEVKPLSHDDAVRLVDKLSRDLGIRLSGDDAERIARLSGGIPLLVHGIINLYMSTSLSLEECIKRVVTSYYESKISDILNDDDKLLLELLVASEGSLPLDILCKILKLRPVSCFYKMELLEKLGFIEVIDDEIVKIRELLAGIPKIACTPRLRALVREAAHAMLQHSDNRIRMKGLMLMAKHCLVEEATHVIESRLLRGSSWMTCCFGLYHDILERLLECEKLTVYRRALFVIEKTLIEVVTNSIGLGEGVEILKKYINQLKNNKALYARIAALLSGMLIKTGSVEEGRKLLNEAIDLLRGFPEETRRFILPTIVSSDTVLAFYENNYEKALEDSIREAELELEKNDFGNYAVALLHVATIQAVMGMIEDMEKTLREAGEVAELLSGDIREHVRAVSSILLSFSRLLEGDLVGARMMLQQAYESRFSGYLHDDLLWQEAILTFLEGNYEEARSKAKLLLEGETIGITRGEKLILEALLGRSVDDDDIKRLPEGLRRLYYIIAEGGMESAG